MPRVLIEDVSMAFGEGDEAVLALQDISLTIEDGRFTSILGPTGCGKTTLLRILCGVLEPTSGRVVFDGEDGRTRGIVFQDNSLFPWRTVLDNVAFALQIRGLGRDERNEVARNYIELVGLAGFENRYPYELSGGMKQRANLARGLSISPEVLLMDEPFASLDAQTREIMQQELLTIWEQRKRTVVFITHQIDEAVYLSDRLIVFSGRPGRIKEDFAIDIPRPRALAAKRTPGFVEYVDRVWNVIEDDVRRNVAVEG